MLCHFLNAWEARAYNPHQNVHKVHNNTPKWYKEARKRKKKR